MKPFLLVLLLFLNTYLIGQETININEIHPLDEYENIHVQKLNSDSNATSFVIWVKKEVKSHKHVYHTENLYVVEGSGLMKVGTNEFEIKKGDYFVIPKNTYHSLVVTRGEIIKVVSVQSPQFLGKDRIFRE